MNVGYIDDSLLVGETIQECSSGSSAMITLVEKLGFFVNYEKSVLKPAQKIAFLGNIIDSVKMTVTLTDERKENILYECKKLHKKSEASIRNVASVIGLIVSSFSAIEFGPLHYRSLERNKIDALKCSRGNFDSLMYISDQMKDDLSWWINNAHFSCRQICHGPIQFVVYSDASLLGWGATFDNQEIGGHWSDIEQSYHINALELVACFNALKSFFKDQRDTSIKVMTDNVTAVSYINNMGGIHSQLCNDLASQIWTWCIDRSIWLLAAHIPGVENVVADRKSRKFDDQTEWRLNSNVFNDITRLFGKPNIDLFANSLNAQVEIYCAWKPDPNASFVDAFTIDWSKFFSYIFPPFSLIGKCLQKIMEERAECIMVVPVWTTQVWYNIVLELLIEHPRILPQLEDLMYLVHSKELHPLRKSIVMMACRLSGHTSKTLAFRRMLPLSSWQLGEAAQRNSTRLSIKNGFLSVVKGRLINFKFL